MLATSRAFNDKTHLKLYERASKHEFKEHKMHKISLRWEQRLANYSKAVAQLQKAVELSTQRSLSELEKQGLIQAFEFTHELAWNVMRDYFIHQGNPDINGSRDAIRESFNKGLIKDGEGWMEMITSRNRTSHTYNLQVANEIADKITNQYAELFNQFLRRMQDLLGK